MLDRLLFARDKPQVDFDFYPYNPNKTAGWVFVVLFAIGTLVHLAYIVSYRSWYFVPFTLGCAAEAGGYYGRAWAHNNTRVGSPYLLQLFLLIGATPLLSASIYMTLSRLVRSLDATHLSPIRISWVSKIYILIDIVCLFLQVLGTLTQAYGGAERQDAAKNLIIGGLTFQLIAFVIFMQLASVVQRRLAKKHTIISARADIHWKRHFGILYVASMLVLVRNLVRIIEFAQGARGAIVSSEVYLYIFDAVPMFTVVLLYMIIYPGRMIKQSQRLRKGHGDGLDIPLV